MDIEKFERILKDTKLSKKKRYRMLVDLYKESPNRWAMHPEFREIVENDPKFGEFLQISIYQDYIKAKNARSIPS